MLKKKRKFVIISGIIVLILSYLMDRYGLNVFYFYLKVFSCVGIFIGCIDYLRFKFIKWVQIITIIIFLLWSILFFIMLILMASGRVPHPS